MAVLLAYIHTPEGDAALATAVEEAGRRSTDAVVVNVTRPAAQDDSPFSVEQSLDAVVALFKEAGVEAAVRQLPAGTDPAEGILAVAAETSPDVVVIGLRPGAPRSASWSSAARHSGSCSASTARCSPSRPRPSDRRPGRPVRRPARAQAPARAAKSLRSLRSAASGSAWNW